jgi:hypothetical protein
MLIAAEIEEEPKKVSLPEAFSMLENAWNCVSQYTIKRCWEEAAPDLKDERREVEDIIQRAANFFVQVPEIEESMEVEEGIEVTEEYEENEIVEVVRKEMEGREDEEEEGEEGEESDKEPVMTRKDALKALSGLIKFALEGENRLQKEEVDSLRWIEKKLIMDGEMAKKQSVLEDFFKRGNL